MRKIKIKLLKPIMTMILNSMSVLGLSQDTIVINNHSEIISKVLEISPTVIKYRKINNLDGPEYLIDKTDVLFIKFKNGSVDSFPIAKPWLRNENTTTPKTDVNNTFDNVPSKKIDFDGNIYSFKNTVLSEYKIQNVLKEKDNPEINIYVKNARLSRVFQNVDILGFPAVMLGLGFLIASEIQDPGINDNYRTQDKNIGLSLITFSGVCLGTTIYLNNNRRKQNKKAVALYNQLY